MHGHWVICPNVFVRIITGENSSDHVQYQLTVTTGKEFCDIIELKVHNCIWRDNIVVGQKCISLLHEGEAGSKALASSKIS